jgi:hypothetical protein
MCFFVRFELNYDILELFTENNVKICNFVAIVTAYYN